MKPVTYSAKPTIAGLTTSGFISVSAALNVEAIAFNIALKVLNPALADFNANPSVTAFMSSAPLSH